MSLTPQQIRSAELLAKGHSQEAVGNTVGVSRRTIARWLKREDFRNLSFGLLGRASQSPQQSPQRSLESRKQSNDLTPQDLVADALQAVRNVLQDPDSRNADRLKAAALVGEWVGLGDRQKMAEMEALQVLIQAGWVHDEAINTLVANWENLSAQMKDSLRGK